MESFSFPKAYLLLVLVSLIVSISSFLYNFEVHFLHFLPVYATEDFILENEGKNTVDEGIKHSNDDLSSNGDLPISKLEKTLSMSHSEMKNRMKFVYEAIDPAGTGIDKVKLVAWIERVRAEVQLKQGIAELETVDKNNDGYASFDEVRESHLEADDGSPKANEELKRRFDVVDKNHDGLLDAHEISIFINPAADESLINVEIDMIMEVHDKNVDQLLSIEELMSTETEELTEDEKSQIKSEFDSYDLDKDGFVSKHEIKEVILKAGKFDYDAAAEKILMGQEVIDRHEWIDNYHKYIISAATDEGELIRFPQDYNLSLPFSNIGKTPDLQSLPRDEL